MTYTKYLIGERFKNNKGFEYEIIGYCFDLKNSHKKRRIRFDSGYECVISTPNIKHGTIIDYGNPTVLNIGYGEKHIDNKLLYSRWYKMLSRCYDVNSHNYKWYGANGVYVCERWLHYKNYEKDVSSMDNYKEMVENPNLWNIDKDIVEKGNKCYCPDKCKIVSKYENISETIDRNKSTTSVSRSPVIQMDKNFKILNEYPSIKNASIATGVNSQGISLCCNGKLKTSGGFIWKHKRDL